jgi:hypothetical protein
MKLIAAAAAVFLGLAAPAFADLTIKQTTSGKGLGFGGKSSGTTFIKGSRMRSDVVDGDKTLSMIFDLDAQKMYSFDSKKKEADVWDMAVFSKEMAKSVDTSKMKVSLTPNGQTKTIAGQTATGYMLEISMPAALGGSNELGMVATLSGPAWIVKGAPGTADYLAFYKAAAEKGWIFSDPNAAKASPGQARAMTEMYRQLAEAGGVAYENDIQIKMGVASGGNPIGGLLGRLGTVTMTTTVTGVDTGALADDLFAPPAGYKLKERK